MSTRLSAKQRRILQVISDGNEPVEIELFKPKRILPVMTSQLPDIFASDTEERRFVENLEGRGLIRVERRHFIYITEHGKAALKAQKP